MILSEAQKEKQIIFNLKEISQMAVTVSSNKMKQGWQILLIILIRRKLYKFKDVVELIFC